MKRYTKEDVDEGSDYYGLETRIFPAIDKADGPTKLTKQHIVLILKWKLGRIKRSPNRKTVSDKNWRLINLWVQKAGEINGEIAALNGLDKIPGIGLATATAMLTVCYPDKFTIIDRRVLEMLDLRPTDTEGWTAKHYFKGYLQKVKEYCGHWDCTLRQADRALWGLSVRKQINEMIG